MEAALLTSGIMFVGLVTMILPWMFFVSKSFFDNDKSTMWAVVAVVWGFFAISVFVGFMSHYLS